jgi:hypothetical protein
VKVAAPLWLAAAVISAFTMRRYLEPFDEGLLLQAATRIADGQWPYADFGWGYGPGQPLLIALAFKAFAPSVLWWRIVRVAADATIAVLVWHLTRRAAGPRWALAAWAAAAVTAAQPTSANPSAVALALALGAVAIAVGGEARHDAVGAPHDDAPAAGAISRRRAICAGLVAALAAFWRPDLGAVAGVAVVVVLLVRRDRRGALTAALTALVTALLLYLPFAIAAGPGELWDTFVAGPAREGRFWSLPFPLTYNGPLHGLGDLKDLLVYELPLIGLLALAAALLAAAVRRRVSPVFAGLLVLGLGTAVYMRSRADEQHAQPLLLLACALVPAAVAARPPRALAAVLAAALGLIALAGAANRVSALVLPPDLEPVHLAGVPGIRVPPAEARALPRLVHTVQRIVPPGEPIYVAPRRSDLVTLSDPLIHFLTRRPNVLDHDVLLQAEPDEQARIVAALRRARPGVIVRWTDPISSHPEDNDRGRPSGSTALDDYLADAYRLRARYGSYDVLVPRD